MGVTAGGGLVAPYECFALDVGMRIFAFVVLMFVALSYMTQAAWIEMGFAIALATYHVWRIGWASWTRDGAGRASRR